MLQSDWFPALLKSETGEILACGIASVLSETGDVNFKSDFVPLFPMGTTLIITRLNRNSEVISFTGRVYISNRTLMRLVSVKREIIADADYIFCDLPFTGTIRLPQEDRTRLKNFLGFKSKAETEAETGFKVQIVGLGQHALIFQHNSACPFYNNQRFLLNMDNPISLPETVIEIEEAFIFGENAAYNCRILDLPEDERKKLVQFLMLHSFS